MTSDTSVQSHSINIIVPQQTDMTSVCIRDGGKSNPLTYVHVSGWGHDLTAGVRQFLKITGLFVVRSFKTKHKKNIFRFFIVKCNSIHKTQAFHQSCAETLPSIQSLISSGWVSETTETVAVVRWVQVLACCGGSCWFCCCCTLSFILKRVYIFNCKALFGFTWTSVKRVEWPGAWVTDHRRTDVNTESGSSGVDQRRHLWRSG